MAPKALPGLRERQKQQRRALILKGAKRLFEAQGIEETSMAAIAAEVGVSTPTVFNYFGSRDELLLALIFQGHQQAIDHYRTHVERQSDSLADDLCELLSDLTARTLEIFSKSVWRYAESTAIRYPQSEFVRRYSQIDAALIKTISDMLTAHNCKTRRGGPFDANALGAIIYNHWLIHYQACLKDEAMTLESHLARMLPEMRELLDLVFVSA